jgi:hypothetical protein
MKREAREGDGRLSQNSSGTIMFEEIVLKKKDGDPELKKEFEKIEYEEWITYPIPLLDPQNQNIHYTKAEDQAKALYGDEVHFDLPDKLYSENSEDNVKSRRKYEIFCWGFLFYHDLVFKKYRQGRGYTDENKKLDWKEYPAKMKGSDGKEYDGKLFEHKIYFEWLPRDKNKSHEINKVRIYISQTPKEFNSTPPPPKGPPPPESNP